jgi:hypothetical protein
MDQAVVNALKRKQELERELGEINRFLTLYDRFLHGTEGDGSDTVVDEVIRHLEKARKSNEPPPAPIPHVVGRSAISGRFKMRGRPSSFAEIMERIIRDARRPLTRSELALELEQRGIAIPSEDKARYLGTILWRNNKRFVNIAGKGYYLPSLMTKEEIANARALADLASTGVGEDD